MRRRNASTYPERAVQASTHEGHAGRDVHSQEAAPAHLRGRAAALYAETAGPTEHIQDQALKFDELSDEGLDLVERPGLEPAPPGYKETATLIGRVD
jgi:hypothetical protein